MAEKNKILIVDDSSSDRADLAQILSEYYHVLFAADDADLLSLIHSIHPRALLLNFSKSKSTYFEICRQLKSDARSRNLPVLALSHHDEIPNWMDFFSAGIDDIICRPPSPTELLARIQKRLFWGPQAIHVRSSPGLPFENQTLEALRDQLSFTEYKILDILLKKNEALVSRDELNAYVWGEDLPSVRALDPHVASLRKKLKKSSHSLKTIYGRGFRLIRLNLTSPDNRIDTTGKTLPGLL